MMMMMMEEEEECVYTKYSMVFVHFSFSISLRYGATKHKPLDTWECDDRWHHTSSLTCHELYTVCLSNHNNNNKRKNRYLLQTAMSKLLSEKGKKRCTELQVADLLLFVLHYQDLPPTALVEEASNQQRVFVSNLHLHTKWILWGVIHCSSCSFCLIESYSISFLTSMTHPQPHQAIRSHPLLVHVLGPLAQQKHLRKHLGYQCENMYHVVLEVQNQTPIPCLVWLQSPVQILHCSYSHVVLCALHEQDDGQDVLHAIPEKPIKSAGPPQGRDVSLLQVQYIVNHICNYRKNMVHNVHI